MKKNKRIRTRKKERCDSETTPNNEAREREEEAARELDRVPNPSRCSLYKKALIGRTKSLKNPPELLSSARASTLNKIYAVHSPYDYTSYHIVLLGLADLKTSLYTNILIGPGPLLAPLYTFEDNELRSPRILRDFDFFFFFFCKIRSREVNN